MVIKTLGAKVKRKKNAKTSNQMEWNGMNIIEMNERSVFYSFQYLLK